MATVENQIVVRTLPDKIEGAFIIIKQESLWKAMKLLPKSALALYLYLQRNQSGSFWALSKKDFMQKTGISSGSYQNAKKELISHGFLKFVGGNLCEFDPTGNLKD